MRYVLFTLAILLASSNVLTVSERVDMQLGCKINPQLVGPCFTVRGRLSTYNGTPSLRVWPIGTKRLLGVVEDEKLLSVPSNIRKLVGFDKDVYGDFLVCPFTAQEPNHMQFVCIEAASNVRIQSRH